MFADPQSLTINAVATSFPRTSSGANSGEFKGAATNAFYQYAFSVPTLSIGHTYTKNRARSVARLDLLGNSAAVLGPDIQVQEGSSAYLVFDRPILPSGMAAADQVDFVKALVAWASASTYAAVGKIVAGES